MEEARNTHIKWKLFLEKGFSRRITMIWTIDPTYSHASFSIRVMGVSTTRGPFHALRGQLSIDDQNRASSWVTAEVDAASIDTHNKLHDAHLRSTAFFTSKTVATYPSRITKSAT